MRLVNLGVEDRIVRDVLRGVLGQALEPVACAACGSDGCLTCQYTGMVGVSSRWSCVAKGIEDRRSRFITGVEGGPIYLGATTLRSARSSLWLWPTTP